MKYDEVTDVTKRFYKEKGIWYIDLPGFLEAGLGTKADLMMVGGADTLLDKLSGNTNEVTIRFCDELFDGYEDVLYRTNGGFDAEYLKSVGHAEVQEGAYYYAKANKHELWLCPVTRYVFVNGKYPSEIYIQVVK